MPNVVELEQGRAAEHQTTRDPAFLQAVLDGMPSQVAVTDGRGVIVVVNRSWREFARDNGGDPDAVGVGADYFAAGRGEGEAGPVHAGLRDVLAGRRATFEFEYPCHSPDCNRWYLLWAAPLDGAGGDGVGGDGAGGLVIVHYDITSRVERERQAARMAGELARQERRLADLLADVPAVVWEAKGGPDGSRLQWTFASRHAERLLGWPVADWLGEADLWLARMPEGQRARSDRELRKIVAGPGSGTIAFDWVARDGRVLAMESHTRVVRDASGRFAGVRCVTTDATRRREVQRTLRGRAKRLMAAARGLRASNAELDQFAYVASHDLRAPLRGVKQLATFLEEDLGEAVPEESREHLRLLRGRVTRMEKLIDGLLEYSRIGRTARKVEAVELNELVRDTADLLDLGDAVRIEGGLPTLAGDRLRLGQVVMNLLENARKHHGGGGTLEVVVSAARQGGRWRIEVADNGPGVPAAFRERIFGMFQTLSAPSADKTGVGLAVVQKIVRHAGGEVGVADNLSAPPGCGAAFWFTWPA